MEFLFPKVEKNLTWPHPDPPKGVQYDLSRVRVKASCGAQRCTEVLDQLKPKDTSLWTKLQQKIREMWTTSGATVDLLAVFCYKQNGEVDPSIEDLRPIKSSIVTVTSSGQASQDQAAVVDANLRDVSETPSRKSSTTCSDRMQKTLQVFGHMNAQEGSSRAIKHDVPKDVELRAYFDWLKRSLEDEDWKADYEKAYQVARKQRWTMEVIQRLHKRHLITQGVKSGVAMEVILHAHDWRVN